MATPERLTALHLPDWRKRNPYQAMLGAALEAQGVSVRWSGIPQGLFPLNRLGPTLEGVDVVHLHWSNDIVGAVVWDRRRLARLLRLVLMVADVWLLRLRGRRLVWTIHNLVSHESEDPVVEVRARRWLARACSHVILHSASALRRVEEAYGLRLAHKASIIPHGNYAGVYPPAPERLAALRARFSVEADSVVLLFFGAIRAYKRVPQLVETFRRTTNPKLRLVIAGSARPSTLVQEIEAAAQGDTRIGFAFGFVAESEVAAYFDLADAVLIPLEQSLTSGSTVLAMTLNKAPVLHEEGRVFDLVDAASGVFYKDGADLARFLDGASKEALVRLGGEAGRLMVQRDWRGVAEQTKSAYG